jgi:hypothetical protein
MYQPALLPNQIRALYLIKVSDGRPMTFHARRAVDRYIQQYPETQDFLSQTATESPEPRDSSS